MSKMNGSFCGSCGHWSHLMGCSWWSLTLGGKVSCDCLLVARPPLPSEDKRLICFKCGHEKHGTESCGREYRTYDDGRVYRDICCCKELTLHPCDVPEAPGRVDALVGPEDQEAPDRAS